MKKKAFTLTELLVVVVIIGVLSAVVLPKFHQVIENRKVTEAEGIMTAVRSEQQARCLLDKGYTKDWKKLASLPSKTKKLEKNYTYTLTGQGIMAKSTNKNYTLRVLSYADGRICCEGKDCDSLNKDYPYCSSMGIVEKADCAAEDVEKEDDSEPPVTPSCTKTETRDVDCVNVPEYGEGWEGKVHYVLNQETCEYEAKSNTCYQKKECKDDDKVIEQSCETGCGKQTRTATCDTTTGEWKYGDWEGECTEAETEERDCSEVEEGFTGTQTRTQVCDPEKNEWTWEGAEWEGECEEESDCVKMAREQCGIEHWDGKTKTSCSTLNDLKRSQAAAAGKSRDFYWFWRKKTNEDGSDGCEMYCGLQDRDPSGWGSSYTNWCNVAGLPSRRIANESQRMYCQPFKPFDYDKALAAQERYRISNSYGNQPGLETFAKDQPLDERYSDGECWVSSDCPPNWKEDNGGTRKAGNTHYRACVPGCGHKPGAAKTVNVLRIPLSYEGPTNVKGHYWLDTKVVAVVGGSQETVNGCPVWRGATEVIDPIPTHIGDCHHELYGDMGNADNRQKMCNSLATGRFKDIERGMCFEDIPLNMNPSAVGMTIQSRYEGKQVSEIISCDASKIQSGDLPFFIKKSNSQAYALQSQLRRVTTTTAVECVKDSECSYYKN